LSTAIKESLAADESKEEENVRLHNSLREEIGRLALSSLYFYL